MNHKNHFFSFSNKTFLNVLVIFLFICLLVIGLYLRFIPAAITEFWLDESLSFKAAVNSDYATLFFQDGNYWDYSHPPFYYILLKSWLIIFTPNELGIRTLSLIFYPLTLIFVFLIGKKESTLAGLISSLWFSVNPLMVDLGFQARMYALVIFLNLGGMYFLIKFIQNNKFISLLFSALLFSLAFYSDYSTIWVYLGIFVYFIYCLFKKIMILSSCLK